MTPDLDRNITNDRDITNDVARDLDPELRIPVLASLAARAHADLRVSLDDLGALLERQLPDAVRVVRRGWRRRRHVEHVSVTLDDTHYELALHNGQVVASTCSIRGAMMRRRRHCAAGTWVEQLMGHLEEIIERAATDQHALRRLSSAH